jgi:hypothetical protein
MTSGCVVFDSTMEMCRPIGLERRAADVSVIRVRLGFGYGLGVRVGGLVRVATWRHAPLRDLSNALTHDTTSALRSKKALPITFKSSQAILLTLKSTKALPITILPKNYTIPTPSSSRSGETSTSLTPHSPTPPGAGPVVTNSMVVWASLVHTVSQSVFTLS